MAQKKSQISSFDIVQKAPEPPKNARGEHMKTRLTRTLAQLDVGQAFFMDDDTVAQTSISYVRSNISAFARRYKTKYKTWQDSDAGGYWVKRIK